MQPHVVVVGGGYAGVMAARTAADHRARVTVVDGDGRHDFLPRLATVAAGVGPADDASAPLGDLLLGVDVRVGAVQRVVAAERCVELADGAAVGYDALVLAAGAQATLPGIPGLADHAWSLRTAEDALALRERLPSVEHLVVVGAGPTGTQLAAEVSAASPATAVTLVEAGPRILPDLPGAMAHRAASVLRDRGVAIRVDAALHEVAAEGAVLEAADGGAGEVVHGTVVWTGGIVPDASAVLPGAATRGGRLVVDRCAAVPDHGPVFAAGDLAAHRGPGGRVLPPTAQVAVRAGALAGANAVRVAEGRRPRPGTLRHIGWVLPLGGGQAVAQVGPVVLADAITTRLAPLLHDAIDLRHLFTVGGLPAVAGHRQKPISLP
jgi:NADH:ubiquinone reductase (H+-translocating)